MTMLHCLALHFGNVPTCGLYPSKAQGECCHESKHMQMTKPKRGRDTTMHIP
jgi:hypothetical protein